MRSSFRCLVFIAYFNILPSGPSFVIVTTILGWGSQPNIRFKHDSEHLKSRSQTIRLLRSLGGALGAGAAALQHLLEILARCGSEVMRRSTRGSQSPPEPLALAVMLNFDTPARATHISTQLPGPSVKIQGWVAKVLTV
jgi:hypothetical protein